MKKRITLLWLAVMLTVCAAFGLSAQAATEQNPIYPSDLNDGTYSISVKSSSSMFRIIDCQLKVSDGKMTAVMTLSGQGYGKLYMGTGEAAEKASESDFIPFVVNDEGKYTYEVPITALDQDTDCAAFSIRKQKWYDRVLVFESAELPDSAFQSSNSVPMWIIGICVGGGIIVIAAAVCCGVIIRQKKNDN